VSISPPIIGVVHLWQACWPDELQPSSLQAARFLLGPAEQQRADRFHFERDRHRFICARAMLKWVLSRYLTCNASAIELVTLNHGKPTLPAAGNPDGIEFNLSHSGNRVAIAIASKTPVGVDIEWMERLRDWQALANIIFSEQELAELAELPESRRVRGFFNGWTRKEAYLKAIGLGLIDDLKSISVSLNPAVPARLIQARTPSDQSSEWLLHAFAPDESYAGALAIQNPAARVEGFTFSPEAFSRSAG
jgi:4'-phosphopantetheinyl transferase